MTEGDFVAALVETTTIFTDHGVASKLVGPIYAGSWPNVDTLLYWFLL